MKTHTISIRLTALAAATFALASCAPGEDTVDPAATPSATETAAPAALPHVMNLSSPDRDEDGYLPASAKNTVGGFCNGEGNRSPELVWSSIPEGTVEFALTMTDPANPAYVHWVVTDLDPSLTGIPAADDGAIAVGTVGFSWQGVGEYAGPCLSNNPYLYTLYALDTDIDGESTPLLANLLDAIDGHVLDEATLDVKVH